MSLWKPFRTIIDLWRPLSTIPSSSGGSTAISLTHPTPGISSNYLPDDQRLRNWPVIKAPPRTVDPLVPVSVRIITLVRDPRSRSFIVSGVCSISQHQADNPFGSSKRKRLSLVAHRISPPTVEILINLRTFDGRRYIGFMGFEGMRPGNHLRI